MPMNKRAFGWLTIGLLMTNCGGGAKQPQAVEPEVAAPAAAVDATPGAPCTLPIESPGEVWKRVEDTRALKVDELVSDCGLAFVSVLSEWRSPPVDLLRPIVMNEGQNKAALKSWVNDQLKAGKKSGQHAAAMDILGNWKIGDDTASLAERAEEWKPLAAQFPGIETACDETADLQTLFASLKEIHELRCKLEVNPLGFAVNCTPLHPPREKIDLTWKEEIQDGIIQSIALTKCKGSRSCKKLQAAATAFAMKYQSAKLAAEALRTEVFREQAMDWLKLPPFSQTGK